jgi:AcrR family transcriptional regulator
MYAPRIHRAQDSEDSGTTGLGRSELPKLGRPRDPTIDLRVFDATLTLLEDVGYLDLSLESVAHLAGVGRPSIYRRWSTKAALVVDALAHVAGTNPAPDTGSLRQDLLAVQSEMQSLYNSSLARKVVPGLLGDLASQTELAELFRSAYIAPRRASVKKALEKAHARGEIRQWWDPEVICDLLAGPMLLEAFFLDRPITEHYVNATVDAVLILLLNQTPTAGKEV